MQKVEFSIILDPTGEFFAMVEDDSKMRMRWYHVLDQYGYVNYKAHRYLVNCEVVGRITTGLYKTLSLLLAVMTQSKLDYYTAGNLLTSIKKSSSFTSNFNHIMS